jgi:hypothetical protein
MRATRKRVAMREKLAAKLAKLPVDFFVKVLYNIDRKLKQ